MPDKPDAAELIAMAVTPEGLREAPEHLRGSVLMRSGTNWEWVSESEESGVPGGSAHVWGLGRLRGFSPLADQSLSPALESRLSDLSTEVEYLTASLAALSSRLAALEESVATMPKIRPAMLYDLGSNETTLSESILVVVEEYDDEAVARFTELDLWASGTTDSEALGQLKVEILSLYEDLRSTEESDLGSMPKSWLRTLEGLIA